VEAIKIGSMWGYRCTFCNTEDIPHIQEIEELEFQNIIARSQKNIHSDRGFGIFSRNYMIRHIHSKSCKKEVYRKYFENNLQNTSKQN